MKTISFHSYKGGVGRTLALANLGIALSQLGKKVVMMDMDFEAPGLPFKFNIENEVEYGYVDYLMDKSRIYPDDVEEESAKKMLKENLVWVNDNLSILPAGNSYSPNYWKRLGASVFKEWFQISENWGEERFFAFQRDHELIREVTKADYLLIDCKGGSEGVVSIPLLLWSDTVVLMTALNREGAQGTLLVQRAIIRNGKNKNIVPVLCRVPAGYTDNEAKEFQSSLIENEWEKLDESEGVERIFPGQEFSLLREQRELETIEQLLLDTPPKKEDNLLLSHDYMSLYERIFKDDLKVQSAIKTLDEGSSWKEILGLAEEVGLIEQYFHLHIANGELLNVDGERNVSLRTDTLRFLMEGIVDDQSTILKEQGWSEDKIREHLSPVFQQAGEKAGEDFGRELMTPGKVWSDPVYMKISERLDQWCGFDRKTGFGSMRSTFDHVTGIGQIIIENHFLKEAQYGDDFLAGYVQGVVRHLVLPSSQIKMKYSGCFEVLS